MRGRAQQPAALYALLQTSAGSAMAFTAPARRRNVLMQPLRALLGAHLLPALTQRLALGRTHALKAHIGLAQTLALFGTHRAQTPQVFAHARALFGVHVLPALDALVDPLLAQWRQALPILFALQQLLAARRWHAVPVLAERRQQVLLLRIELLPLGRGLLRGCKQWGQADGHGQHSGKQALAWFHCALAADAGCGWVASQS